MGDFVNGLDARNTALTVDAESGFLISNLNGKGNQAVTVRMKLDFLEEYRRTGNFSLSARTIGAHVRTMYQHMDADEKFRDEVRMIRQELCDKAEGHIVEHMSRPQNVVDRLAWLRAYRPSIWNTQGVNAGQIVNIQINGVDNARQIVDGQRLNSESSTNHASIAPGVRSAVRSDGSSNVVDTTAQNLTPVNNTNQPVSPDKYSSVNYSSVNPGVSPTPPPFASAWDFENSEKKKRAAPLDPNHVPPPSRRSRTAHDDDGAERD